MSAATRHGGDRIAEALQAHGVEAIFTLCGGHISPILAAAKARGIRIVDTRDEATAVFAADAHARLAGRPGVAAVTAGPGITNTITALKNAQLAQSPLLLLGGAAPTALQGRGALQDIDQRPLVTPHVKRFFRLRRVRDLAPAVAEGMALAASGVPGPVFLECPVDLLYDEASIRQWYAEAAGKGSALADRALRWYLNRHAARMFAGSAVQAAPAPLAVATVGPFNGQEGANATFSAVIASGVVPEDGWVWDFGGACDPNGSNEANPTVRFVDLEFADGETSRQFQARLIVSNDFEVTTFPFTITVQRGPN